MLCPHSRKPGRLEADVKRTLLAAIVSFATLAALVGGSAASARPARPLTQREQLVQFKRTNGYLVGDIDRFRTLTNGAAASAGVHTAATGSNVPPHVDLGWNGVRDPNVAPPDSTGAIGPKNYIEAINLKLAVYDRAGNLLDARPFGDVTACPDCFLSDPQILWDPHTQRFYYLILKVDDDTFLWGFSKTSHPTTTDDSSWCTYDADFGYGSVLPDYPKMAVTTDFILIGSNDYIGVANYLGSNIDWLTKPQGSGAVTTCPDASTFQQGEVGPLMNCDGTPFASDPNPAVQVGIASTGWIVAIPDATNSGAVGNYLDLFKVTKNEDGTANIPQTATSCVDVPPFSPPAPAPQKDSNFVLDTLDGRLTRAMIAQDPQIRTHGKLARALYTQHTIAGGAGAEVRWYEINVQKHTLFQSGDVASPDKFIFDGAIASDRRVGRTGKGHYGTFLGIGFTVSSPNMYPSVGMVSKHGVDGAMSPMVLVKQAPGPDSGFDCTQNPYIPDRCRWGDYSAASPDPAADVTAGVGRIWFTNMFGIGSSTPNEFASTWDTWNWEATP